PGQRKRKRPRLRGAKWYLGRKHPTEDAGNLTQTASLLVAEKSHVPAKQRAKPWQKMARRSRISVLRRERMRPALRTPSAAPDVNRRETTCRSIAGCQLEMPPCGPCRGWRSLLPR